MSETVKFEDTLAAEIAAQDHRYPFAIFKMKRSEMIPGTRSNREIEACFVVNFVKHGYMDMASISRFERTGKRMVHLHIPESFQPKDEETQKNLREIRDHLDRYHSMRAEVAREMAEAAMGQSQGKIVELPGNSINEKLARKQRGAELKGSEE